jgi:hypothetical protein
MGTASMSTKATMHGALERFAQAWLVPRWISASPATSLVSPPDEVEVHRTRFIDYAIVLSGEIWAVMVHIINRPGQPFLGAGETGQGPAAGAVANAVADTVGKRLRDLPLSRERIRKAISA